MLENRILKNHHHHTISLLIVRIITRWPRTAAVSNRFGDKQYTISGWGFENLETLRLSSLTSDDMRI